MNKTVWDNIKQATLSQPVPTEIYLPAGDSSKIVQFDGVLRVKKKPYIHFRLVGHDQILKEIKVGQIALINTDPIDGNFFSAAIIEHIAPGGVLLRLYDEKRGPLRVDAECPVEMTFFTIDQEKEDYEKHLQIRVGKTLNISKEGILVNSDLPMPVGITVVSKIFIDEHSTPIMVTSKVLRCEENISNSYHVALEPIYCSSQELEKIEHFCLVQKCRQLQSSEIEI
ncbi:PilZ domain-containing protein [Geoalkalibacter subterraneus]|uniref:PilZ domain-containing protein n=1 Tax=Geoalkalibacter subterraneus TaxID=483547 RepID=A0A0B5FL52_9BACT|nr:PilZ domain-containing protein [Geoalkalibacter subterraneus]AJF08118.1 hypothetical protein GSUB_16540 [Geoalkalibacter subterraneus]